MVRAIFVVLVGGFLWSPWIHGLITNARLLPDVEASSFWDGSRMRGIEQGLASASFLRAPMLKSWAVGRLLLLHEGSDPMIIGSDAIIFDGRYLENPVPSVSRARLRATADGIAVLDRKLRGLGVPLLVFPVPVKGWVLAQHVPAGNHSTQAHYRSFLSELSLRGVDHVDLLTPLAAAAPEMTVYFRSDTHWSCLGAEIAARLLGERLLAVLGDAVRVGELRTTGTIRDGGNAFDKLGIPSANLQSDADITTKLLRLSGHLRDEPIRQVVNGEGVLIPMEQLRGDPESPVVLLGTSFSLASGFLDYLAHFTGNRVRSLASPGAGAMGNFQTLLDQGLHRLPVQLVWEWPSHEVYTQPNSLPGLQATLVRLPQVPMVPLSISHEPFLLPPGPLNIGERVQVTMLPVSPLVTACGALSLRVRGRVRNGPVQIRGAGLLATVWDKTEHVDVPIGQLDGRSAFVIDLESGREGCVMSIDSVEWLTDGETLRDASPPEVTVRRGDALLVSRGGTDLLLEWPELPASLHESLKTLQQDPSPFALLDLSAIAGAALRLPPATSLNQQVVLLRQRVLR
jgi:alginate O-acetyltransferase complex protein AlgJ